MCKWNYLRFNSDGTPHHTNEYPRDGKFALGFCGEYHAVMLCYKEPGQALTFVDPSRGLTSGASIVAWADIGPSTMPDLGELKRRKTLHPPVESLEWAESQLASWKRSSGDDYHPIPKAEAKRSEEVTTFLQARIASLKTNFVLENSYHMPPVADRVRPAPQYAMRDVHPCPKPTDDRRDNGKSRNGDDGR